MLGFLIGEAVRDLRRAGRVAVSAIVLITLSLAALGGFWLLSVNLERAVARWRERVRIIVYLKREPAAAEAKALVERVQAVPGVAGVLYIGKAEALASLKQLLGKDASASALPDRKSTRLNSSHSQISYAVFCFKKKKTIQHTTTVHINN